jgi:hypothetical protein
VRRERRAALLPLMVELVLHLCVDVEATALPVSGSLLADVLAGLVADRGRRLQTFSAASDSVTALRTFGLLDNDDLGVCVLMRTCQRVAPVAHLQLLRVWCCERCRHRACHLRGWLLHRRFSSPRSSTSPLSLLLAVGDVLRDGEVVTAAVNGVLPSRPRAPPASGGGGRVGSDSSGDERGARHTSGGGGAKRAASSKPGGRGASDGGAASGRPSKPQRDGAGAAEARQLLEEGIALLYERDATEARLWHLPARVYMFERPIFL